MIDKEDGSYQVFYELPSAGRYVVHIEMLAPDARLGHPSIHRFIHAFIRERKNLDLTSHHPGPRRGCR